MTQPSRSVRLGGSASQHAILNIVQNDLDVDLEWHAEIGPSEQEIYQKAFTASESLLVQLWTAHQMAGGNPGRLDPGSNGAWRQCPNELAGAAERTIHAAMTAGLAAVEARRAAGAS